MSTTAALLLSLIAAAPGAESRSNEVSAADSAKARQLVQQLADSKFKVRDAAERQLVHLGVAALGALKEGEKHSDLHVQERCRQLQPVIRSLTLQKRINAFLADREGTLPSDLPLVSTFIKATGDSREARQLYAEIVQSHGPLLDEAERNKTKGAERFGAYCQEVNSRLRYRPGVDYRALQRTITKTDVALFFLLSTHLQESNNQVGHFGYTFLNSPDLSEHLAKQTAEAKVFQKLFLHWMKSEKQQFVMQRALQLAIDAKMSEAMPLVLKHVADKNSPAYSRAQMALLLAKVGNKEHLKEMEPLLEDKTVIGNFGINNVQGQVQMRDVALAVSIKLSGQKLSDYDFDVMKGNNDEIFYNSYVYCAFTSDAKRAAAHKKYKESLEKLNNKK